MNSINAKKSHTIMLEDGKSLWKYYQTHHNKHNKQENLIKPDQPLGKENPSKYIFWNFKNLLKFDMVKWL